MTPNEEAAKQIAAAAAAHVMSNAEVFGITDITFDFIPSDHGRAVAEITLTGIDGYIQIQVRTGDN